MSSRPILTVPTANRIVSPQRRACSEGRRGTAVLALGALILAAIGFAVPARADGPATGPTAPLPLFIAAPPPSALLPAGTTSVSAAAPLAEPESIYHGLYVGTEIFGVSGHGIKGGIGGDIYAGYAHSLSSGAIVGVQGGAGYSPSLWGRQGLKGFDFGEASAEIAYPMGRFTPFLTAGVVVARPVTGPGLATNNTDSFNDLLNGSGNLYAAPRVGAGVSYALTSNTSVSLGLSVGRGLGAGFP